MHLQAPDAPRPRWGLYLHHFHCSDDDLELHNHPWRWAVSLMLKGGYSEERRGYRLYREIYCVNHRVVRPWYLNFLRGEDFHRVDLLEGEAWSLFLVGPLTQSWGFWNRHTALYTSWKVFLGLAAFLLAFTGCFGSDYQIHADPGISPAVFAAAQAAAADWEANVPVKLTVDAVQCPAARPAGAVCLHPVASIAPQPWEPGVLVGTSVFNDVWLDEPALEATTPAQRQRVIAHELGHSMGLLHTGPGSLMYPYVDGGSVTVTPVDVGQWWAMRGGKP